MPWARLFITTKITGSALLDRHRNGRELCAHAAVTHEGDHDAARLRAQNAGKRSIELDLKEATDRAAFEDMVCGADVLLENFRAGVLARLGFDWPRLHELNPRLVYCAISGFGQTGPMSRAPAYDQII